VTDEANASDTLPRDAFLDEMRWRGFTQQCTGEAPLRELLAREPVTAYIGFDPTADSLHVGSLLPIMGLVHLQRHGHRPIAIAGGGTALVGDPSGKTEMRDLLTREQIAANLDGIRAQLARFLRFGDGPRDGLLLDNATWLEPWRYVDFLRDIGRHFRINEMLKQDSVKLRLEQEQGLSFLEFNYLLLQAYDFLELNRRHGCRLQMGGNDQWGNICAGVDLTRAVAHTEVYGLTFPLLTTATGAKMGKTADGAVWLDARRTSSYDFFQYWINVDDRDVSRFLRLYTLLDHAEIEALERLKGADLRDAKRVLARAVTALVHGTEEAVRVEGAAAALFGGGGDAVGIPSSVRDAADFGGEGLPLADALVAAGLCGSKGEARRLVRQGGVRVNGENVGDEMRRLVMADVRDGVIALQVGKKAHHHLRVG
jgi:tyrosyl-tRNA synthetase